MREWLWRTRERHSQRRKCDSTREVAEEKGYGKVGRKVCRKESDARTMADSYAGGANRENALKRAF